MNKRWFAVIGSQSSGSPAPATYTISGTVYDADGSTAVEGATVTLGELTGTSAANGTYTIADVPPGTNGSMTCTKAGYLWAAISISAVSDNLTGQNYTNTWYSAGGSLASCIIAYKPKGAADLAASKVNLANPGTYNAAAGVDPSFNAATGWGFSSASATYLTTGYIPANAVTRSIIVRVSGLTTDGALRYVCGSRNGATSAFGIANDSTTPSYILTNGSGTTITGTSFTAGVIAVAGLDGYIDGSDVGNITAGTYDQGARAMYIGCRNSSGTPLNFITGNVLAFAEYDITLTPTQVAILSAAMADL
jgi:hypothetical protein